MRTEDGPKPKHRVYALLDGAGQVRFVGQCRQDRPAPWRLVWQWRDSLPGKLAAWFRTLDREPEEITVMGAAAGLHKKVAKAAARTVTGWHPAAIGRRLPCGRRAVGRVEGGRLTLWPSCAAAARALRCHRGTVYEAVDAARLFWID